MTTLLRSTNVNGEIKLWFPSNIQKAKTHAGNEGKVDELSVLTKEKRTELDRSLVENYPTFYTRNLPLL